MTTASHDHLDRIQRRQMMRNAEGYLDLIMVFDDRWPLDRSLRDTLADRAIECLSKIREPKGHLSYILFLKGQACRACEKHERAVEYLAESLELNPENIHCLLAIAWCYKRLDQIELAIGALESAVELDEKSDIAHYNLACYWAIAKNVDKAVKHLGIALELNPEYRNHVPDEKDFDNIRDDLRFLNTPGLTI